MAWTFTTLKSAIQDYTNNTESTFVSYLDEFIVNTEDRIQKLVSLPVFRKNVTGTLTLGNQYLSVPTDFLSAHSFIVAPTPNANFTAELHYEYTPTSITTSSDGTSYLGTNASDCLLYGSLLEAYTFMKGEPDIMANYEKRFQQAIDRLKVFAEGKNTKDNYRSGPVRQQVT